MINSVIHMHKLDHKPDTKADNKSEPQVGFVFARGLLKNRNASDLSLFWVPSSGSPQGLLGSAFGGALYALKCEADTSSFFSYRL